MDKPKRVLIVEDSPADAELVEREVSGIFPLCEFRCVETAEDFLATLKSFPPDIILSDYRLPSFNGMAALKLSLEHTPEVPFIIVTGSLNEDTAVECMKTGAWDYVIKEHLKQLGSAIAAALERKRLLQEQKLARERSSRWERVFEEAQFGLAHVETATDTFLEVNATFARERGYQPEELKGRPDREIFAPEVREHLKRQIRKLEEKGHVVFESVHLRKNGSRFPVLMEVTLIKDEQGRTTSRVGYALDITERKRGEIERERLMAAIEQAGDSIMITDIEGRIQYVNPAFETVTGYTRNEVIGKNPRFLKSGKQDTLFYQKLWKTISNGETWLGRLINKRKDGATYTEEATISAVRDDLGTIVNYVAVKRDITAQLKLEGQYLQAQKLESVGRLAGGIAHDFNNNLNVILGYAQIAQKKLGPDSPIAGRLEEIKKAAIRSTDLIRQLLVFSRKQIVQPQVINLNDTITNQTKMLKHLIGEDIELAWLPEKERCIVKMDPGQIDQIIANLCVNARDAISGIGKIIIETQLVSFDMDYCAIHPDFTPGDFVRLEVRDNGCGMEQETLEKVFEPFFTTKDIHKGTGLGLSTVYGIVRQNQGFINVYSQPGKGSSFSIYLPLHSGEAVNPEKGAIRETPFSHGETILIVEDQLEILNLSKEFLESIGYKTLTTQSPMEAIRMAREHVGDIHLVLTDVVMPEMNGKALSEQLQTLHPKLNCLYMSGYPSDVIAHHGLVFEGINFIQKPFSMEDLAISVRKALA